MSSSALAIYPHINILLHNHQLRPPTDSSDMCQSAPCQRPVSRSVKSAYQSFNLSVRSEAARFPVGRSASQSIKETACRSGGLSVRPANSQLDGVHQRSTTPTLSLKVIKGSLSYETLTHKPNTLSNCTVAGEENVTLKVVIL